MVSVTHLAGTLKGGTAGAAKGPMSLGDPFAAFLAVRKVPGEVHEAKKAQPLWRTKSAAEVAAGADAADDPFASFLALRPARPAPPPETLTEQSLREDLLRTKRELLEVGLKAELKVLDPACPPQTAAQLRRVRRAQRYLQHPERTLEALSGAPSEASEGEEEAPAPPASAPAPAGPAPPRTSLAPPVPPRPLHRASAPPRVLLGSLSAPSLSALAAARDGTPQARAAHPSAQLPPLAAGASVPATPLSATTGAAPEDKAPLLQGWYTRSKSWNIGISNKEQTARRHNLSMSGGTVILGNGRMPVFTGSHLLSSGFFFCFQVDALDERHFPLEGCRDLSFGFGVSRYPPQHRKCERPVFAYEIPDSVLLGYGDHLIDKGKWWHTDWNPRELKEKDVVGVLVPPDGTLVVFVNGEQVLRVPTSLHEDGDFTRSRSSQRRTLFPVVDLHGRVSAVTLLPRQAPPNRPLQGQNRLR